MILKLENTTTHQIYEYEVKDMNNGEKLYFRFDIDTSDLVDGEYILSLYDGEKLVANDLLKIGDYNPSTLQYKKGENTYINVTLDNSVQGNKTVVIETIDTTITPDDGFNSMGKVDVNAQPIYDEGYNVGNAEGIEVGKAEQKALLEPISITENGTYENENGYSTIEVNVPDTNGSYDEGYTDGYAEGEANGVENAGSIIAETARVLDITENGLYLSRYSEPPTPDVITGVYPDGTEFYNYAELNGKVFDTKIPATPTTRLEMWYKGDNTLVGDAFNVIIGAGKEDGTGEKYEIRYLMYSNSEIMVELGLKSLRYTWDENAWHHILIAKETEDASVMSLWIDEVKVGDFNDTSINPQSTFYINGIEYDLGGVRRANGCFGMVKIDDTIIIPTADGFLNTNTGELLEVVEEGGYVFTDNMIIPEGNLIKTVKVNITPIIKFTEYGMKCSYSSFKTLPSWVDLNGMTDYSYMFTDSKIEEAPYIDTSKAVSMRKMYANCFNITSVPLYDVKNATDLTGMFSNTQNLQYIPNFELGTNVNISELAYGCNKITKFPQLDTSGVVNMQSMVYGCTSLTELPALDASNIDVNTYNSASLIGYTELKNLTKAGGLIGLRRKIDDNYGWVKCPNLDYESCINILNGLFDFTGNGITPNSNEGKLKVHQNFLTAVGDEISIATNKGWTITS